MKRRLLYNTAPSFICMVLILNVIMGIFVIKKLHSNEKNMEPQTQMKNISAKEAKELIEKENDVFILDVRTKDEYNEVHIKDANLIPIQELEQNIDKIPKDKKIVVHCASGKRSAKACEILKDKGLKELYNMEGGIKKWQGEGYPVIKP